jgi:hypothetical protein
MSVSLFLLCSVLSIGRPTPPQALSPARCPGTAISHHDVTRYYRRAVNISDPEELAGAMTEKLAELSSEEGKGGSPRKRRLH